MSKRYDVVQAHKRGDKTFWNKIGTLWEGDDGKMSISFDALPVPQLNRDGNAIEVRAMVFEPKPRDGQGDGGRSRDPAPSADDNGDIPF